MDQKTVVLLIVVAVWLIVAAIVIGYPVLKGQIKVGTDPVSRELEPQRFWISYLLSTVLFLMLSVVVGVFVHGVLR